MRRNKPQGSLRFLVAGLTLVCTVFISCDDYLENVTPDSALPLAGGLDSPEALETFLLGAYDLFSGAIGERLMIVLPDLGTEDITSIPGGCENTLQFDRNDVNPGSAFVQNTWRTGYEVINHCNLVIEGVNKLRGEIPQDVADGLAGEAHFLRGVVYFEMVRMWALPLHKNSALGLPLVLTGVDNTDKITYPSRDPVADVYTQIEADLTTAMQLLPVSPGAEGRASYYAAVAYLAEVAFQNEDYASARARTQQIIDGGAYQLVNPPELYFEQKQTSEDIWSLVHTEQDGGSLNGLTQSPNCQATVLSPDLFDRAYARIITEVQQQELDANAWTADDLRYSTLTHVGPLGWHTSKYPSDVGANNVPAMRYAEVLLMYAESQAQLGNAAEAITYLNMIRKRSIVVLDNLGNTIDFASDDDNPVLYQPGDLTNEELIEAIILERQVELVMEGNRFHDLIRLRRDVNGFPYDANELRWPIPQSELDANPSLVQNPGYE